jgi:hypothetical protein
VIHQFMPCISNVINKIKLTMNERSEDVLNHIQIMASWRITCEDKKGSSQILWQEKIC